MSKPATQNRNDNALRRVVDGLAEGLSTTLGKILDRPVESVPNAELQYVDLVEWRDTWMTKRAVVRGEIERGGVELHRFVLVFDLSDAITFCGHLMLASDDTVQANREAMAFGPDQFDALGELGNVLCNGLHCTLRSGLDPKSALRVRQVALVEAGTDTSVLGRGKALVYSFHLQFHGLPAAQAHFMFDHEIARVWNDDVPLLDDRASSTASKQRLTRRDLATFVSSLEAAAMIRECAQELDVAVKRHAKTDVPNPAALTNEIALIEIPVGEEKRFDWAKRLTQSRHNVPVVLLIHEPSRPRVVQGLLTRASAILAWPSTAPQILEKLAPLLDDPPGERG